MKNIELLTMIQMVILDIIGLQNYQKGITLSVKFYKMIGYKLSQALLKNLNVMM